VSIAAHSHPSGPNSPASGRANWNFTSTPSLLSQIQTDNRPTSLMQAGCSKIYITSRKANACDEAVAALNALPNKRPGAQAIAIPADFAKISEIERFAAEVAKTTDHIDILFANAGATWGAPFETHPESAFSKVMDLNVKSVFYSVQKLEPLLRKRATIDDPSRIIITASVAGLGVGTLGSHATYGYSASKAAAIHLAKNLAVELGPRFISCNAIAPGFYPSKMASGLMEMQGGVETLAKATPNQRVGHPEDIAGLVVFLASRAATHLNGSVITTDGGSILGRTKL
jgi:NAD(P)-dependent dehydrogenase (short-subunit alcohol dehydrogenase family)